MKKQAFLVLGTIAAIFVFLNPWAAAQQVEKKEEPPAAIRPAVELDPVVVTGTRTEEPISHSTKSISVLNAKERDDEQQYFLPSLINDAPGVDVRGSGGPGQFTTLSIRGAWNEHVQFQYNGLPLRDAADTQGTLQYLIGDLYSGSNLSRVEVLRGPQSTLYGSQAMAGVINIVPEKWKKGFGAELRNEYGSHNTLIENGRVFYGKENFYFDINPLYVHSNGEKNGGVNGFGYENRGLTGGLGVKLRENMTFEFSTINYDSDVVLSTNSPSLDAKGNLIKPVADKDKHREGLLSQQGGTFTHRFPRSGITPSRARMDRPSGTISGLPIQPETSRTTTARPTTLRRSTTSISQTGLPSSSGPITRKRSIKAKNREIRTRAITQQTKLNQ